MSAAKVEVKADTLADQGTAWRANAGSLKIEAQQHQVSPAENTQETTVQRLAYGGDARLDTSTGEDLNVRAAGKGGSLDKKDIASTAVPGSLYGQQGIQVQLGSDGRYEGARIDGGEGSVVGVVLGATLLRVLQNLVTLLHIPSSLEFAVTGAVIMAGVLTDEILRRRRKA